jgi:hypothetical protein
MGFIIRSALLIFASMTVYKFFKGASQKANDDLEAVRQKDAVVSGTLKKDPVTGDYKL